MRMALGFLLASLVVGLWLRRVVTRRGWPRAGWFLVALIAAPGGLMALRQAIPYVPGPATPTPSRPLATSVSYERIVRTSPRPLVAHVVRVDLRAPGVRLGATRPDDPGAVLPFRARTTSQFVRETGAVAAVNGDFFEPWRPSLLDEYPAPGDPVRPLGVTRVGGAALSTPGQGAAQLALGPGAYAEFGHPGRDGGDVVGGLCMIALGGALADLAPCKAKKPWQLHPRTAVALDEARSVLWLIVVDGRQPRYSMGAELEELASLLVELGAHDAMNLDGGGSSALAVRRENGVVETVSSPIAGGLPGRERPVANHIGVYVDDPAPDSSGW